MSDITCVVKWSFMWVEQGEDTRQMAAGWGAAQAARLLLQLLLLLRLRLRLRPICIRAGFTSMPMATWMFTGKALSIGRVWSQLAKRLQACWGQRRTGGAPVWKFKVENFLERRPPKKIKVFIAFARLGLGGSSGRGHLWRLAERSARLVQKRNVSDRGFQLTF